MPVSSKGNKKPPEEFVYLPNVNYGKCETIADMQSMMQMVKYDLGECYSFPLDDLLSINYVNELRDSILNKRSELFDTYYGFFVAVSEYRATIEPLRMYVASVIQTTVANIENDVKIREFLANKTEQYYNKTLNKKQLDKCCVQLNHAVNAGNLYQVGIRTFLGRLKSKSEKLSVEKINQKITEYRSTYMASTMKIPKFKAEMEQFTKSVQQQNQFINDGHVDQFVNDFEDNLVKDAAAVDKSFQTVFNALKQCL